MSKVPFLSGKEISGVRLRQLAKIGLWPRPGSIMGGADSLMGRRYAARPNYSWR